MTPAQQARIRGFQANLRVRGRAVTTDTSEALTVLVQDQAQPQDPDQPAQQKLPVFTRVSALTGILKDPRAVGKFTEASGRWHKVLRYEETSGDQVTWQWFCEAQRAP